MEIRLFGKSLLKFKSAKSEILWTQAESVETESKYLPDFYTGGRNASEEFASLVEYVPIMDITAVKKVVKKEEMRVQLTPKGVYELKLLHDQAFKLNTDPKYIDQQLTDFKDKLSLIKSEEFDMRRGVNEISSIVMRLENRKKYAEVKDFFEQYPYTTTSKIEAVTKAHNNLQTGQMAQFIADLPKDAVQVMKKYNKHTGIICDKQAVFYIVADKKDFKNTTSRRDPILLAQSPFGHFWQILGAWDKEMMFLEEL